MPTPTMETIPYLTALHDRALKSKDKSFQSLFVATTNQSQISGLPGK